MAELYKNMAFNSIEEICRYEGVEKWIVELYCNVAEIEDFSKGLKNLLRTIDYGYDEKIEKLGVVYSEVKAERLKALDRQNSQLNGNGNDVKKVSSYVEKPTTNVAPQPKPITQYKTNPTKNRKHRFIKLGKYVFSSYDELYMVIGIPKEVIDSDFKDYESPIEFIYAFCLSRELSINSILEEQSKSANYITYDGLIYSNYILICHKLDLDIVQFYIEGCKVGGINSKTVPQIIENLT